MKTWANAAAGVFLAAAVLTVAWPFYHEGTRSSASAAAIQSELRALVAAEDSTHARTGRYSALFAELGIGQDSLVRRHIVRTRDGWYALASRTNPDVSCSVWVGSTGIDPADEERVPACETQRDWTFLWYAGPLLFMSVLFAVIARYKNSLTES